MNEFDSCSSLRNCPTGVVEVWYVDTNRLDLANIIDTYWQIITPEERAAVERFRLQHLRVEALVARALQRWVLSQYAPVRPAQWRFAKGPFGRPYVKVPAVPCPSFNLSHSRGMVVCAVSSSKSVGVDVEDVTSDLDIMDLAKRYFAPPEANDVIRQPPEFMSDRFFRYWTLKEAYVKATGFGLSLLLDSFAIELNDSVPPRISFYGRRCRGTWRFAELSFPGRYHVSIAADSDSEHFQVIAREVVPFSKALSTTIECCSNNLWFAVSNG
ncbi:4'-phosphopantetheinyl transferase family protein [Blastopirellula retiformator]|uniref:4'-phosphopantetheinyl transferase sfp n=1 Tax=Blastopirellula retiformator TaxID=2527970 RepID=A0A5C5VMJ0_9BACT|nr:4'-phosphopantetheinyl transferase superfamily protein [Blastopirellula retiformator]TWT38932.1 4'-phosphopantetheinyl transferase sfp [Blastopirellula retiformator]